MSRWNTLCFTAALIVGCTSDPATPSTDAASTDAASTDAASADAASTDTGSADAGSADAGAAMDGGSDGGPAADVGGEVGVTPDAGADVGVDSGAAPDVAPVECRVPIPGTGCNPLHQRSAPVDEMQVATAPPVTTAGFYPAGTYALTSSTIYTGPGGASGPSGLRYAATLDVHGMGSVDYFDVIQEQAGCPTTTYRFTGDTFATTTKLFNVTWTCPTTCTNCGTTLPYSGNDTTFLMHFPLSGGRTLVQVFTLIPGT